MIAAGLAVVACKQPAPGGGEQVGSGGGSVKPRTGNSSASGTGSAAGTGSISAPVAPKPAPVDPAELDKALRHKHVAAKAVIRRASGPGSQWALIAHRDKRKVIRSYDLLRVRADGVATLSLEPPKGNHASFQEPDDAISIEVRDLDGDGNDDALVIASWTRRAEVHDPCEGCWRDQDESASQLFVVSGDGGEPKTAFTHLVKYTSSSESYPEGNDASHADPDDVEYDWKVVGTPPVLELTRSKAQIATEHRLPGTLTPTSDPLLSAGAGKDVPLILQ